MLSGIMLGDLGGSLKMEIDCGANVPGHLVFGR